jgi:hypothetical protein
LIALGLLTCGVANAQDAELGRTLYEGHCTGCHERSVHRRESRIARDFEGLRAQVQRWSENSNAAFREDEVDSVAAYLNQRYYGFPCPPVRCGVQKADAGGVLRDGGMKDR